MLELDRNNTHAYHNRGISYEKKGEYLLAIRDFTRGAFVCCACYVSCLIVACAVLELDPSNANAYFNRGSAYDSIGDFDAAIADYTRALDLDMSAGPQQQPRSPTGHR